MVIISSSNRLRLCSFYLRHSLVLLHYFTHLYTTYIHCVSKNATTLISDTAFWIRKLYVGQRMSCCTNGWKFRRRNTPKSGPPSQARKCRATVRPTFSGLHPRLHDRTTDGRTDGRTDGWTGKPRTAA